MPGERSDASIPLARLRMLPEHAIRRAIPPAYHALETAGGVSGSTWIGLRLAGTIPAIAMPRPARTGAAPVRSVQAIPWRRPWAMRPPAGRVRSASGSRHATSVSAAVDGTSSLTRRRTRGRGSARPVPQKLTSVRTPTIRAGSASRSAGTTYCRSGVIRTADVTA